MTTQNQFQVLFSYHFETLGRLVELAGGLDPSDYQADPGYGNGSIHALLRHILAADRSWRVGLESGSRPASWGKNQLLDLDSLKQQLSREEKDWQAFLSQLTPGEAEEEVRLQSGSGRELALPMWRILQHVNLHAMQHFSEIGLRLTEFGQSPGNIDFIYFKG